MNDINSSIVYHEHLEQGSGDWIAARCGLLTASEMHLIVTPTLKIASNDKERSHLYELLAQRVTNYVEPAYVSDAMLRGQSDEIEARLLYAKQYGETREMGFITNSQWGFTLGYSPDALVGDRGAIECKSRCQKYQVQTVIEHSVPPEFVIQLQAAMLIAQLEWIDFVSYCGGLPLYVQRVWPDKKVQQVILSAASAFEERLAEKMKTYVCTSSGLLPTERRIEQEMYL